MGGEQDGRKPFDGVNLDEEGHEKLLSSMKRSASYIKKNKIRLKNGEVAAQKVELCRQEFASRQMNRAQKGPGAFEEPITDNTFTDLEPASLQVIFPSTNFSEAPGASAVMALLEALGNTSLRDVLFNEMNESWDAESLLEDLIESGGLVDYVECGNIDVVNRDVVDALFEVFINCYDQGIVYGSYKSLALMLSCREKEWMPDTKCFIQYLNRIGYSRDGLVVDWEKMECKASTSGCTHCPIATGKVQLYLRLLSAATISNPAKFSNSCSEWIIELFSMLVHLFLDISGDSYETDLILALDGLVAGVGGQVFENLLEVLVDKLKRLGPTHRSQVRLLHADWNQLAEVQSLKRLWGLTALKMILPVEVPLCIEHSSFIHKHCMKVVLGILNSSDVILSSLQTAHRMKGGKVTTIDWWLLDSIMHTLEGLLVLCIIEGTDAFTSEERAHASGTWNKFLVKLMQFSRSNPSLNSVGYSNVKHHLRKLQVKWDSSSEPHFT